MLDGRKGAAHVARPRLRRGFCDRFGLQVPILLAPMAGACPPSLSVAVANAGGIGAAGILLLPGAEIASWMQEFRTGSNGSVQLNVWIPDPPPERKPDRGTAVRGFVGEWGPSVTAEAADAAPPDFAAQCEAMLEPRRPSSRPSWAYTRQPSSSA